MVSCVARLTISAADTPQSLKGASPMKHSPVVKDCWEEFSITAGFTYNTKVIWVNLLSTRPGSSWNQNSLSLLFSISSHLRAAWYHASTSISVGTTPRSSLFHLILCKLPPLVSITGYAISGAIATPWLPLACQGSLTLHSISKSPGDSFLRVSAAWNPSTSNDCPPRTSSAGLLAGGV